MSEVHRYKPGLNNVGSFQVSGRPFLTGSGVTGSQEIHIEFPSVTKSFTVVNRSNEDLLIHFVSRTNPDVISQHHYMTLPNQDDSYGFDVKCKEVYVSLSNQLGTGSFEMHGELTGIDPKGMHALSGSGINAR